MRPRPIVLWGSKSDCRNFRLPAAILGDLGVGRVGLLSNNPRKASALMENRIEVVAQLAREAAPNPYSLAYLRTKKEKMGHTLGFSPSHGAHLTSGGRARDNPATGAALRAATSASPIAAITPEWSGPEDDAAPLNRMRIWSRPDVVERPNAIVRTIVSKRVFRTRI